MFFPHPQEIAASTRFCHFGPKMRPGIWTVEMSFKFTFAAGMLYFSAKSHPRRRSCTGVMLKRNFVSLKTSSAGSCSRFSVNVGYFTTTPNSACDAKFHTKPDCTLFITLISQH
jgi:hypothetical protein